MISQVKPQVDRELLKLTIEHRAGIIAQGERATAALRDIDEDIVAAFNGDALGMAREIGLGAAQTILKGHALRHRENLERLEYEIAQLPHRIHLARRREDGCASAPTTTQQGEP